MQKNTTFLKKRGCGPRTQSVNTPSPAAQRCTNGAPDGPRQQRQSNETQTTTEVRQAGRADKIRAHPVSFVSTLFEIDIH